MCAVVAVTVMHVLFVLRDMCMCLAWDGVGGEGSVVHVSVFWLRWCGWGVGRGLGPGSGEVGRCYVCVRCESGFSV